ncbi:MAG: hypothetical protein R3Y12_08035 [Clostridia bacterium]
MSINFNIVDKLSDDYSSFYQTAKETSDFSLIEYDKILESSLTLAKEFRLRLDYSRRSITFLNMILTSYSAYANNPARMETVAFVFGIYLGETMLQHGLEEAGYKWAYKENEPMPGLTKNDEDFFFPIERIHRKICDRKNDISLYYVTALLACDEDNIIDYNKIRDI